MYVVEVGKGIYYYVYCTRSVHADPWNGKPFPDNLVAEK